MRIHLLLYACVVHAFSPFFGKYVNELSADTFTDQVLYNGNVSAVVFYAPWCGYCRKLVPEWSAVGKSVGSFAHVAALNCDEDSNKRLCAKHGVQGFPTIKVFQPAELSEKDFEKVAAAGEPVPRRRPVVHSYDYERSKSAITRFVESKLRNYVSLNVDKKWLEKDDVPKAVLVPGQASYKVSPLLKALSRDYFGKIRFGVAKSAELVGVKPSKEHQLVFVSGGEKPIVHKGKLKKKPIMEFLDQQSASTGGAKQEL